MNVMKKVMILAVVAALLGISAPNTMAQVPGSSQPSSTEQEDERDQPTTQPSSPTTQPSSPSTQPSTQPGTSGTQSGAQQGTSGSQSSSAVEYKEEVKTADLPAAITRSINEKYPGYKTEKAFRGADGTYKVKISKGDEMQTLFFDERGESVKMQK
ncbi:MAG TPA: hypothetical protein VHI78_00630 [Bacteroidales bacterium]|jgi:hypothetical protein|nr:hypothetical protein [Bacteroidales bacterium]